MHASFQLDSSVQSLLSALPVEPTVLLLQVAHANNISWPEFTSRVDAVCPRADELAARAVGGATRPGGHCRRRRRQSTTTARGVRRVARSRSAVPGVVTRGDPSRNRSVSWRRTFTGFAWWGARTPSLEAVRQSRRSHLLTCLELP